MAGKKLKNPRREMFCQYYVTKDFFGNGLQAYAEAYDLNLKDKKNYNTATSNASKLLRNAKILDRINEIMDHAILNDPFVDREMAFVIQQKDDLHAKMRAIAEYNKVKKRVEEGLKVEFPSVTQINILNPVEKKKPKKKATKKTTCKKKK